jgi:fibro-slime domain-containing protein
MLIQPFQEKIMNTTFKLIAATSLALASLSANAAIVPLEFEVTLRDFRIQHDDFQKAISGVATGMVAAGLDANGKPVYVGTNGYGAVTSAATFATWYSGCDATQPSTRCIGEYNVKLAGSLNTVTDVLSYTNTSYFPLDGNVTLSNGNVVNIPTNVWDAANVNNPAQNHNYFFTTELKTHLIYDNTKQNVFSFTGDDDVWVFINGQLVLDLGGVHSSDTKVFDLDNLAGGLGIVNGGVYDFRMFHAERYHVASTMNIVSTLGQPLNNVPEPETLLLLGLGLAALGLSSKKTKR